MPAAKLRRLSNTLLDGVIQTVFIVLVLMVLLGPQFADGIVATLLPYLLIMAYYIIFESLFSWTPAKLITGTRVVDENGQRPSFGQIVGRSFIRLIPIEALSFLGKTGRGWHDSWSKTYVVRTRF